MAKGFGTTFKFDATASDKMSGPLGKASSAVGAFGNATVAGANSMAMFGAAGKTLPGIFGAGATAATGLTAALGPIAIVIGALTVAFGQFKKVVDAANAAIDTGVESYGAFETKLAEVQTILGVTRKEMDAVADSALNYAATYGKGPTEELAGFYMTASAGFADAAKATTIMDTANRLAVAGVTDMESSVDLLTTILNGYQVGAEGALDVSDALFTTVRAGKTTVGELAAAFGNVVPSSSAAGATFEETMAALAAQTLAGQSTAEASTALARAFDVLIKKPPVMLKAFKELGVEEEDLDVKGRGLQAVIKDIGAAFKGHEEDLAKAIPQIRAFKAIMPLATSQAANFERILGEMGDRAGATTKAMDAIADSMDYQKSRWAAMTEAIRIRVGEQFSPAMKIMMDVLNEVMSLIEKLPPDIKKTVFSIIGIGMAVPAAAGKITSFIWSLTKLALALGAVVAVGSAFMTLIPSLALSLGPGIARLVKYAVAWRENLDDMQGKLEKFVKSAKLVVTGLGEAIQGEGRIEGEVAQQLAEEGLLGYVGKLYAMFKRVEAYFKSFWGGFSEAILQGASSLEDAFPEVQALMDLFAVGAENAGDLDEALPLDTIIKMGKAGGEMLGSMIGLVNDLSKFWDVNKQSIKDVVTVAKALLKALFAIAGAGIAVWNAIRPIIEAVRFLGNLPENMDKALFGKPTVTNAAGETATLGEPTKKPFAELSQEYLSPGALAKSALNIATGGAAQPLLAGVEAVQQVIEVRAELQVDGEKMAQVIEKKQVEKSQETFQQG